MEGKSTSQEGKSSSYQKRMSMMNSKISSTGADELSLENPEKINQLYVAVLDHLLTAPHIKDQLMESQSLEKKLQTVRMHNHLFESMNSWGDKENMLLASIQKMKLPDIPTLSRLKIILATGNLEMMISFLDSGGVSILLKAIENRLMKKPTTELDIAILFEILSCFKAIMKNSVGMEGVSLVQGSIDIIARCLRFDYKQFALQILEILSVCSFYSEEMAMKVLHAMKEQARYNQEAPFSCLTRALVEHDIEVKAAIMQFINALIMAIPDTKLRLAFRSELRNQLFDEALEQSLSQVDKELLIINNDKESAVAAAEIVASNGSSIQKKLQRKSMVTVFGPRAYDERKVDAMIKNSQLLSAALSDTGSIVGNKIEIKSNQYSVVVNPLEGTMAGLLHAAKNADKIESRFLDIVGGKKTKRRWYELDQEHFKWCGGHDKDADYKGLVKVSTITDIRPYTTDSYVAAECQHCFEIETSERTYALGCETATEKDNWLTALQRCRDNYLMSKGSYKLQFRELSTADVNKFAQMFHKQAANYQAIAVEDRRHQLEVVGLDMANINQVSRYLQLESVAAGNGNIVSQIFYELLLIPPGADGVWEAVALLIPVIRQKYLRDPSRVKDLVDQDKSIVDLLKLKFKENNNATYTQVSKLALAVMNSEQEIARLEKQISELNKSVQHLQETIEKGSNLIISVSNPLSGHFNRAKPVPSSNSSLPLPSEKSLSSDGSIAADHVKEIESFTLSESSLTTSKEQQQSAIVPSVDPRLEKYEKMKKMLPEGAVRQKMALDGFSEQEIGSFFAGTLVSTSETASSVSQPINHQPAIDLSRYEKYEKMKKMLPEGAVRQKMSLDGFSDVEIEKFFDGSYATVAAVHTTAPPTANPAAPPAATATATAVDLSRFEKYEKMKKMLPEGAVRQKMNVDGFSAQEIEAFFNGTLASLATSAASSAPESQQVAADPRFEKFVKMRKMLPEGAVRQKMGLEGFSEQEINDFFEGKIGGGSAIPAPSVTVPPPVTSDPRFEKYEKMKKMLPEGAVRQKMAQDGFSPIEIESFFGGGGGGAGAAPKPPPVKPKPVEEEPPIGMKPKPRIKPSSKLRGLFWNKLKAVEVKDTIWYQLSDYSLSAEEIQKLEEYFSNAPSTGSAAPTTPTKTNSNQPKLVSVLDGKRTQNILILLGKLRKSPEEVLAMIIDLNPKILTQELTNSLTEIVPTAEEITAIKAFSNPLVLDLASQMVYHLNRVPKLAIRLECHELGFSWEINAKVSINQLTVLLKGCQEFQQLKPSFQSLLAIILAIGNYINGDSVRGQAYGVKLDVLIKFANLKAAIPSHGTLMNYLSSVVEDHHPQLITAFSELSPAILASADIPFKQLQQDISLLETQYNKVIQELGKIKEAKENPGFDGALEDKQGKVVGPLFQRLTTFKQKTSPILQEIKSLQKKTEDILSQILIYYNNESLSGGKVGGGGAGEEAGSEGGDVVKKFFGMILEFSRLFQTAIEENKQKRLLQEKQAQAVQEEKDPKGSTSPAPMLKDVGKTTSDIFGQFHKAQKASNDQLLEEFKNKLKKQMK